MDEDLEKAMAGKSRITFYLEANDDGFAKMGEVRMALQNLKEERSDCGSLLMTLENLKEQLRPQAEKQVKVRLALEKIAKQEKLTVSAKEIEAEYKRIAEAYNMPLEQVKELIAKDGITADMKVKAAIDLVKEKAIVK